MKKTVKRTLALIPAMILWLMFSVLIWGWVFTLLTDTRAEYKVTLYIDAPIPDETALAAALEEALPPGIRMIKAHSFTYAMYDGQALASADLYVVPASHVEQYLAWFRPLPAGLPEENCLTLDGESWGILVRSGEGAGFGGAYIDYGGSEAPREDFYLFFGRSSLHVPGNGGALDGAAVSCALRFLSLP